jgi:hypothetical protein
LGLGFNTLRPEELSCTIVFSPARRSPLEVSQPVLVLVVVERLYLPDELPELEGDLMETKLLVS